DGQVAPSGLDEQGVENVQVRMAAGDHQVAGGAAPLEVERRRQGDVALSARVDPLQRAVAADRPAEHAHVAAALADLERGQQLAVALDQLQQAGVAVVGVELGEVVDEAGLGEEAVLEIDRGDVVAVRALEQTVQAEHVLDPGGGLEPEEDVVAEQQQVVADLDDVAAHAVVFGAHAEATGDLEPAVAELPQPARVESLGHAAQARALLHQPPAQHLVGPALGDGLVDGAGAGFSRLRVVVLRIGHAGRHPAGLAPSPPREETERTFSSFPRLRGKAGMGARAKRAESSSQPLAPAPALPRRRGREQGGKPQFAPASASAFGSARPTPRYFCISSCTTGLLSARPSIDLPSEIARTRLSNMPPSPPTMSMSALRSAVATISAFSFEISLPASIEASACLRLVSSAMRYSSWLRAFSLSASMAWNFFVRPSASANSFFSTTAASARPIDSVAVAFARPICSSPCACAPSFSASTRASVEPCLRLASAIASTTRASAMPTFSIATAPASLTCAS